MAPLAHRHERLADQIRIEIAEMIEGELKDPRIGFATVTHVDLSPDLRHARVLVTVLGGDDAQRETLKGLASAAGYVRREIVQRLRLRRAPDLVFEPDREAAQAERVESLLKDLHKED